MKKRTSAVYALLALTLAAAAFPGQAEPGSKSKQKQASITIVNKSKWSIHELYLTPTHSKSWGPDQLRQHTIDPGESYTLTNIACDDYDIKLVDQDHYECIVEDVDFCFTDDKWVITQKDLARCQAHS